MNTLKTTFLFAALAVPTLAIAGAGPDDLTAEHIFVEEISVMPIEALDSEIGTKSEKMVTRSRLAIPSPELGDRTMTLYASDKTAEVKYEKIGSVFGLDNNRFNVAFLFNEERDNAVSGTIMYDVKPVFLKGLKVSFGPKVYAGLLSIENADVFAVGVATELAYQFPFRMFPLQLQGSINYAPDILTFGQSDRIVDWSASAGFNLTDNIFAFAGIRFLQFDTNPGDRELDNQAHLGVRWSLESK